MSLLLVLAAAAQHPCVATDFKLPPPFSAWTKARAPAGSMLVGTAYRLELGPSPRSEASKAVDADGSFNGFAPLRIDRAGRYGVALSHAAWIDVTRGKEAALRSIAHGHGPACSTIRKVVDFDLSAGTYLVQIGNSPAAEVKVMIVRR